MKKHYHRIVIPNKIYLHGENLCDVLFGRENGASITSVDRFKIC